MEGTTILKQIIEEIKSDPFIRAGDNDVVIVKEICNKIQKEENKKLDGKVLKDLLEHAPKGASIYLTLPIPYQKHPKEVSYITLERDALDGWCVCYYIDFGKTGINKLKKRHEIPTTNPNHVMTKFAKIYKGYLGKEE